MDQIILRGRLEHMCLYLARYRESIFRQNTRIVASRHGVSGWVSNMKDGRVEIVLEGNEEDVGLVVEWCFTGPPSAKVYDVDVNYEKYHRGVSGFHSSLLVF